MSSQTKQKQKHLTHTVWHKASWAIMWSYIINLNLVRTFEHLDPVNAITAIQMNDIAKEWFRTTVGARQGCLLLLTFFLQHFLERNVSDNLWECN